MLKAGDRAPGFSLPTGDGKTISLKDFRGKKVVLYFYPKDDTSGCTKEACSFEENLDTLRKKGAVVIGVSADNPDSHEKFAKKYGLLGRYFLHAAELRFTHPKSGAALKFESPLPAELRNLLERIRA